MKGRYRLHALVAVLVVWAPGWLVVPESRATSIQDLLTNSKGKVTYGALTFTFDENSVSSSPAGNPTAAQVDVSEVNNGIMFSFNPMLSLTTATESTQTVTITYSVQATFDITTAGLSFTGTAVDVNTSSKVTESFLGQSMDVYVMQDDKGKTTKQTNQSVALATPSMSFSVTDMGQLSVPTRGGGATSTAQLYDITNTFSVPEPPGLLLGGIAAMAGLCGWWRVRRATSS